METNWAEQSWEQASSMKAFICAHIQYLLYILYLHIYIHMVDIIYGSAHCTGYPTSVRMSPRTPERIRRRWIGNVRSLHPPITRADRARV